MLTSSGQAAVNARCKLLQAISHLDATGRRWRDSIELSPRMRADVVESGRRTNTPALLHHRLNQRLTVVPVVVRR
jgi:hypothetical protein